MKKLCIVLSLLIVLALGSIAFTPIKSGGIIAGHDYTIGNWVDGYRYGVIEAVNEFCVNDDWEMIFLTAETDQYRSFAIRKIS